MPASPTYGRYSVYAIELGFTQARVYGGVTDFDMPAGITTKGSPTDGGVTPTGISITEIKPTFSFTTMAIDLWLGVLGFWGLGFQNDVAHDIKQIRCFGRKHAEGGLRSTGSDHRCYTIRRGMIVPNEIRIPFRDHATLACNGAVTWDGVNDPIYVQAGAVPAFDLINYSPDNRYGLPSLTVGGLTLRGINDVTLAFGAKTDTQGEAHELIDRHASMDELPPTVRVTGNNLEWFDNPGLNGLPGDAVSLTGRETTINGTNALWLRRWKSGTTFWADDQAKHIKLEFAGCVHLDDIFRGGRGKSTSGLTIPVSWDRVNDPIKITLNTAIS